MQFVTLIRSQPEATQSLITIVGCQGQCHTGLKTRWRPPDNHQLLGKKISIPQLVGGSHWQSL